ncbi:hypothetical protein J2S20_000923 [Moryella indoligenes]|uniref:ATPase n=1 Tax=Moryella indoligenes TaxID=371674 RepID=A0AAE3VA19_9FIRM|nr:hypothetical protein [Moryella indoligenes]MDQ0152238.1 hypothetical protein [Moryella indoligenes]
MDNIIEQLNDIEHRAAAIMEAAIRGKKALTERYAAESADWDAKLAADSEAQIAALRKKAAENTEALLSAERESIDRERRKILASYEQNHALYTDRLFESMTQE